MIPHLKYVLLVCCLALAGAAGATPTHQVRTHHLTHVATHQKVDKAAAAKAVEKKISMFRRRIDLERRATWAWQMQYTSQPTRTSYTERSVRGLGYLRWTLKLWKERHKKAQQYAQNPPHKREWLCIHRFEGSWKDPNPPYYGGLQMDEEFQMTYGKHLFREKGTADNWTPLEQMWVAEKAYVTRGFWPWPNTARYCNLQMDPVAR